MGQPETKRETIRARSKLRPGRTSFQRPALSSISRGVAHPENRRYSITLKRLNHFSIQSSYDTAVREPRT
jgi:hypothetical protein